MDELFNQVIAALNANTAALNANTEAHGGTPARTAGAKTPAAGAKKPAIITAEQVKAAVMGVAEAFDKAVALKLIKQHAKANKIVEIKPSFYAAVMEACAEKMAEQDASTDEAAADEDDGL